jgi:hypothetical protein
VPHPVKCLTLADARRLTAAGEKPVSPGYVGPQWPMQYDISLGVRRGDARLRSQG